MMENLTRLGEEDDEMILPPGFRFHPTNEELITHYLSKKVADSNFSAKAIVDVDMNKTEPWELPRLAKMGEKEWYFFCIRDKKYPTGLRTNRATDAGYWKATGKDKEIYRENWLVGMKKTLVFYKGRAPKGEKTNWVIHEYRLEGKSSLQNLPKSAKNEWVLCRVFHKNSGEKKFNFSGLTRVNSGGIEVIPASLPPLMDSSARFGSRVIIPTISESVNVPCFSNPIEIQTTPNNFLNNPGYNFNPNPNFNPFSNGFLEGQSAAPVQGNSQFNSGFTFPVHDQEILKGLIQNCGQNTSQGLKIESQREMRTGSQETGLSSEMNTEISSNFEMGKRAFEDQEAPSTSVGPIDYDGFWNY